ncbi:MAG: hypothetical protein COV91_00015 [Candidatus Taylorbacteria bacterium CG11_big_fil_rev_8_21_14_0_20_46_11]|uniref:Crp/Fnr family transcriptional regulator n=1 Tax=Candidatus Taylorbacteria bacterium CG11_big_fil_rev_8_21_14_0_20_46_11 TaxID=1975025 RepID=A0A2H0KD69_9BACT|nr:MAG: hypothetical protein COV91_00015 [Candidatus Taylorbacteria bacterium CG11_big_fil_rev_8_21_14_0_20_46_11]
MTIIKESIKQLNFFKGMTESTLEAISRVCASCTFGKQEIIYLRGDSDGRVFLVLKGEVELFMGGRGARIVIQTFREGDFFGDLSFVNHPTPFPQEEYAQASKETEVCVLVKSDMLRLLETNPLFTMALLLNLRDRLHHAESKIKDLAISEAPTRLLNELIRYASSNGKEERGFYHIGSRLTHQHLADLSGLARETVTKTLALLFEKEFISLTPLKIISLNIQKITKDCAGCIDITSMQNT